MSFIERNQRFVKVLYKEIESKMIKYFEKGVFDLKIFEYKSTSTKAFCMPEIKTKYDLKIIKKLYDFKFDIMPIAKIGTKIILVAYNTNDVTHKEKLKQLKKVYSKYAIIKIREKGELNERKLGNSFN